VLDLVAPGGVDPGYSLTRILEQRRTSPTDMVRIGERFYTSLGFAPLPKTFWERSLFVKPVDRDVVCHASAWDIDAVEDLRIKMCIDPTEEDFSTIHHELGHNFYQRAYKDQPVLFRDSANQAFHEAISGTFAVGDAGTREDRPARSRARYVARHRVVLSRASKIVPAVRPGDRSVALGCSAENPNIDYNRAWWERRLVSGRGAPVGNGETSSIGAKCLCRPTTRNTVTSSPTSCGSVPPRAGQGDRLSGRLRSARSSTASWRAPN
jgi:peptidyl-dipeptidase A